MVRVDTVEAERKTWQVGQITDADAIMQLSNATKIQFNTKSKYSWSSSIYKNESSERFLSSLLLTAKHMLGRSVFTPKQVFGPPTAKSQPIRIKFCKHLSFCGIHLWVDLDRDRSVGGSRPNQNDYVFFVILVTHPNSIYTQSERRCIAAILAANRQSGGEDGCYREKFRNFVAWAEPDPKTAFSRFMVPFDYPAHSLQETVLPQTNGTDGKPRLWRCAFLLVCRVCDQA